MNKKVKKSLQFVVALMVSLGLVFALTPQMAMANVSEEPQQATKTIQMDTKVERITKELSKEGYNIQLGDGKSDDGAGIYMTSHTPGATYSCYVGKQIRVDANCYDLYDWQDYYAWFGIWDTVTEKYVDISYTDYIADSMESWYAYLDTSVCSVSSGRYEVDAVLYDDYMGWIEAIDSFNLTVKAMPAPTMSSAASSGVHSAKLSWSGLSGVTGYAVYKSTSSTGTYTWVANTSSTTYNCTGLTTGRTYYFKVRAYCSGGEVKKMSSYSSYKTAKPMPLIPTPTAASSSYTSNKISWSAVSGASGYVVYRSTSSGGPYSYIGSTTGTSYTNSSLTTGKTYYYKVRSYHTESSGTKYYSGYSSYKYAKPIPAATTATSALKAANDSIRISWKAVSGASGYLVYRSVNSIDGFEYIGKVGSSTLTWVNTGLLPGQTYYYKIRAYHVENSVNVYGVYSAYTAHATLGTPSVNAEAGLDGTSVNLSWSGLTGASGYAVYRMNDVGIYDLIGNTSSGSTNYVDTGLATGVEYTYQVRAFHNESTYTAYGSLSDPASVFTSAAETLDTPVLTMNGLVYDVDVPGVRISWTPVENASGYVIEFMDMDYDTEFYAIKLVSSQDTTYTDFDSIDPDYVYYAYRVWAYYGDPNFPDTLIYSDYSNTVYYMGP